MKLLLQALRTAAFVALSAITTFPAGAQVPNMLKQNVPPALGEQARALLYATSTESGRNAGEGRLEFRLEAGSLHCRSLTNTFAKC